MKNNNASGLSLQGRVRALIYGIALGDALGAPVEKLSANDIATRYGRVSSVDMEWHKMSLDATARNGRVRGNGIITDDTLMTLCLMDIYADVQRHLDAWDMADGMVRQIAWIPRYVPELQREAMLIERLFYPEKWIFQRHQLTACDPRQGGIGNMVNCGAAMYIAPIGVVNACDPKGAYQEAIAFASGHQESYGLEAAGIFAAAVAAAFVPNTTVDIIVETVLELAKDGTRNAIVDIVECARRLKTQGADHATVTAEFHKVIAPYSPMGDDVNHTADKAGRLTAAYQPNRLGSIEELPLALGFCILNDGDFRLSIEDGINSGRDTDSIGVMAGAILGAMHGETVVCPDDYKKINQVNRLDLMASADKFTATVKAIQAADLVEAERCATNRTILLN